MAPKVLPPYHSAAQVLPRSVGNKFSQMQSSMAQKQWWMFVAFLAHVARAIVSLLNARGLAVTSGRLFDPYTVQSLPVLQRAGPASR